MPSFGREVDLRHVENPLLLRGSRIDKAKLSRPSLARSFPPSLIEGSVRPEQFGALPRGRGPHTRSGSEHSTREGRTLRAVRGPPRARSMRVPLEMTGGRQKHDRRTMGRTNLRPKCLRCLPGRKKLLTMVPLQRLHEVDRDNINP
jgi:hypothetical protein